MRLVERSLQSKNLGGHFRLQMTKASFSKFFPVSLGLRHGLDRGLI
jgi:hypothetical protein